MPYLVTNTQNVPVVIPVEEAQTDKCVHCIHHYKVCDFFIYVHGNGVECVVHTEDYFVDKNKVQTLKGVPNEADAGPSGKTS
jgi:hypothetical protein